MSDSIETHPPPPPRLNGVGSPIAPTKLTTDTISSKSSSTAPEVSYLSSLQRDGYVVVPSILPVHLLIASQATCKYLVGRARPTSSTPVFWPYVRTVPKQYPPWPNLSDLTPTELAQTNIWGVQHLLHPDLESLRDVYAEVYFSEEILSVVRQLLADPSSGNSKEVTNDDLVMELFNLLISPARQQSFELEWHRDDIRPDVSAHDEERLLKEKTPGGRQLHAQYNLALFEDESLIVVPGSHRRVRTEQERTAGKHDVLPGEVRVKLNAGDAVFYDSNILHRGAYEGINEKEVLGRMTLHGSVGLKGFGEERARQVLQHGVGAWIERPDAELKLYDEAKKVKAEKMRMALIEMGKGKGNVGYSLQG